MEIKNSMFAKLDPYRNKLDPKAEAGGVPARGARADSAAPQAAAKGDRISLSSSAKLHTVAHSEANKAAEVRQDKVNAIKEQVDSGQYRMDARKVAEKLLQNEADFAAALRD